METTDNNTNAPAEGKNNKGEGKRKPNNRRGKTPSKRPKGEGGNVCFSWAKNGTCQRGDGCKFLHQDNSGGDAVSNNDNGGGKGRQPRNQGNRGPARKDSMEIDNDDGNNTNNNNNRNGNNNNRNRNGRRNNNGRNTNTNASESAGEDANMPEADTNTLTEADAAPMATKNHITDKRFADLPISAESRRAMKDVFKYEFMTVVQAETLPVILKGGDCLAKAKTGTGKTLAFCIPAVELLVQQQKHKKPLDISCLIISPTRELAFQISKEAEKLVTFQKNITVVCVVGGTSIGKDHRALKNGIQILVATPGRLLDHLGNTSVGLVNRLANLSTLVLDEVDQLLDMGFRPDVERILAYLEPSSETRQTLLFSATVPDTITKIAMRPEYSFVNTVSEDEEQTHMHVQQEAMVSSQADQVHALAGLLAREASQEPYKVICFFTTARLTGFMAELFNSVKGATKFGTILEIHSRKSQSARQKASDQFRKSRNAILFTSDVTARGMDYDNVTAVLQVGFTERDQYIHRLGRTARAGKSGHGVVLMAPYEKNHMMKKELQDLPMQESACPPLSPELQAAMDGALRNVSQNNSLRESAEQAYRAWLGYYNGNLRKAGWDKKTLVQEANQWAKDIGLKEQPKLLKKTVGKMGLKGVPGLLLE
eukprot:CAMPEP_0172445192 /NCGR_PEP_ID=MMETSP1065-20121228/5100_1 /TAXON_ID=265537 /ORGANISM="Amphiprora paludosa, Strain CCMP125" /LENGTH=652 /DNA_ID=CAMNT_0013195991 /DNA_START=30 /DNA_END=1988 /DNA_ORIENTATION=-